MKNKNLLLIHTRYSTSICSYTNCRSYEVPGTYLPARPDELEEAVGKYEYPSEHFLLVQLHELIVVSVGAHVYDSVHVKVEVVDRLRVLLSKGREDGRKEENE